MAALAVVQCRTACPPEVMVLARGLSAAIEAAVTADLEGGEMDAAYVAMYAAEGALLAGGWCLTGPTDKVPGGALSWVVERAS